MGYLRNCWYLAAWSSEVGDVPLGRRLLGEPVALFRDSRGLVHGIEDKCPHRLVPLSLGKVSGDSLECIYHGLRFDGSGACSFNPHGPVTRALGVSHYPVVEANRAIWIWLGEPDLADAAKLPRLDFLGASPDTAFNAGYLAGAANYQLYVDNILDLTHGDYVHPNTLGGGSVTRSRPQVTERADGLTVRWNCPNEIPWPIVVPRLPPHVERVDSFTEVEWMPASIMILRSAAVPHGEPMDGAESFTNVHIMTPESADRTHYFYASTRNFAIDDRRLNEQTAARRAQIFSTEDEPIIRAQQQLIGDRDFWEMRPQLFRNDEGAVRVRRKLAAMIEAEQGFDKPGLEAGPTQQTEVHAARRQPRERGAASGP